MHQTATPAPVPSGTVATGSDTPGSGIAPVVGEPAPLPEFRHFTISGVAVGDDPRYFKAVTITFRPGGQPSTVETNGGEFTAIGDDAANRDLYGAIFGT